MFARYLQLKEDNLSIRAAALQIRNLILQYIIAIILESMLLGLLDNKEQARIEKKMESYFSN